MSLFKYFTPSGKNTRAPRQAAEAAHLVPVAGAPGALTAHEVTSLQKVLIDLASEHQGPSKRAVYSEKNNSRGSEGGLLQLFLVPKFEPMEI